MIRVMWGPDHELVVIKKGRGKLVNLRKPRPSRAYLFAALCFLACAVVGALAGTYFSVMWLALGCTCLALYQQKQR